MSICHYTTPFGNSNRNTWVDSTNLPSKIWNNNSLAQPCENALRLPDNVYLSWKGVRHLLWFFQGADIRSSSSVQEGITPNIKFCYLSCPYWHYLAWIVFFTYRSVCNWLCVFGDCRFGLLKELTRWRGLWTEQLTWKISRQGFLQ